MSGGPGAAQVVLMDTNTKERLYAAARRATQRYPGPHPAVLHDRSELALQRLCSRPRPQIASSRRGTFAASLVVAQEPVQNVVQPGTGLGLGAISAGGEIVHGRCVAKT
jgi:hypothetical protein